METQAFPRLVAGLCQPEAYPSTLVAGDARIDHLETHISHVFLVGDRAFKLKKPVNLGFLDFSTLERRHGFCLEELRLNQRLAPQIYLGLVAITGTPDQPRLGGEGPVLEYVVEMKRFDQADRLDRCTLTSDLVDRIAGRLAAFHAEASPADPVHAYGTPDAVLAPMLRNFAQIRARASHPECTGGLDELEHWTRTLWQTLIPTISQRRAEGRVRECHGDLHRGNIALLDGEPLFFDALEFDPNLRWIDTASELAFLLMDLQEAGEEGLARRLLNRYLELSGDYEALQVLDLYLVYRALVRAKVLAIRLEQPDLSPDEIADDRRNCARYLNLALSYTRMRQRRPRLLINQGLSGSGKSHFANQLRQALPLIHLRSDLERKRLFGLAPQARSGSVHGQGIYSPQATTQTYDRLQSLTEMILGCGYDVLVDATFLHQDQRARFQELAERLGAGFAILAVEAPLDVMRERISRRAAAGQDPSEAGLEILDHQLRDQEPLVADELTLALIIDSEAPPPLESLLAEIAMVTGLGLE